MAGKGKPDVIPEEEFKDWLRPEKAVELVNGGKGRWEQACRDILRRADSELIKIRAERIEWRQGGRSGKFYKFTPIPPEVIRGWLKADSPARLAFWSSGEGEWETRPDGYHQPSIHWRFFDVWPLTAGT